MEISTTIAMFQGLTCDKAIHAKVGGDVSKISSLGCGACLKPDLFGEIIDAAQNAADGDELRAIKELGERWVKESAR